MQSKRLLRIAGLWTVLAFVMIAVAGADPAPKPPATDDLQAQLDKVMADKSLLVPDWYRARYQVISNLGFFGFAPFVGNQLFVSAAGLSAILIIVSMSICALFIYEGTGRGEVFGGGLIWLFGAAALLCAAGHFLITLITGIVFAHGDVPWDFSSFCVLIFADLTLLFVGVSIAARRWGKAPNDPPVSRPVTVKTVLLSLGKAFLVAAASGLATTIGGWVGGVAAMGVLSVIAAIFNPKSS